MFSDAFGAITSLKPGKRCRNGVAGDNVRPSGDPYRCHGNSSPDDALSAVNRGSIPATAALSRFTRKSPDLHPVSTRKSPGHHQESSHLLVIEIPNRSFFAIIKMTALTTDHALDNISTSGSTSNCDDALSEDHVISPLKAL